MIAVRAHQIQIRVGTRSTFAGAATNTGWWGNRQTLSLLDTPFVGELGVSDVALPAQYCPQRVVDKNIYHTVTKIQWHGSIL